MKKQNKGLLALLLLSGLVYCASCEEALEKPIDNDQVVLRAPGDSVVAAAGSQIFYWDTLQAARKYELEVVTPGFNSMTQLVIDTILSKNQLSVTLVAGQYQWRVRAKNNSTTSRYSAIRTLTLQ